jgi:BirA family biotin operon repressor/biotin-[acetyl-CoA-carboxylase] ligase
MPVAATPFLARLERFASTGSTNDVVRGWLRDGTPEVCIATADEQTAGRGREGRAWMAPPRAALLLSAGFRPTWLDPERTWRLGAVVALAMAEAAETAAGLAPGTIELKWPNDLVVVEDHAATVRLRKLGGVLGESDGLGTDDPRVVVGIGTNVDWPAAAFPPELAATMTSLEAVAGRMVGREGLLDAFLGRLAGRVGELREGSFDATAWADRQVTTGRAVRIDQGDRQIEAVARGVDPESGALLIADPAAPGGERAIHAGEIVHLRLAPVTAPGQV